MSRRFDAAVLVAGTLIAATSGAWWWNANEATAAPEVTSIGARPDPDPGPDPVPTVPSPAAPAPVAPAAPPSPAPAAPVAVQIPSLNLAAEIDAVGVRDDGQVAVPEDGDRVGWYRFGPAPGADRGSAVLVGHRDTRAEGPGVLYRVGELGVGDRLDVVRADWTTARYTVVARESFTKDTLPSDQLFRRDGEAVLTVITCGGPYTPGVGYRDNVVITAVLDQVRTPGAAPAA
jgi:hypothetical protein